MDMDQARSYVKPAAFQEKAMVMTQSRGRGNCLEGEEGKQWVKVDDPGCRCFRCFLQQTSGACGAGPTKFARDDNVT
jgi:hypothetical protein